LPPLAVWLLAALASYASAAAGAQPQSTAGVSEATEQRIRHIEDHLLPPVLVDGEAAKAATLVQKMHDLGVPGVSIAFFRGGKVEWTDAVGVTRQGGPAVDASTVFQAASISKPVTAMAVMTFKQSGKLDLDQDVNVYLKSWRLPDGNATASQHATIRRLLSHTAGMSVHGFEGYSSGDPIPSLIQILNGETPANSPPIRVATVPGSIWSYSGGGYVIVQQMLGDLTRTGFAELMGDRILKPAGMQRSSFDQPISPALQADAASPYDSKGQPIPGGVHTYPEQAAAGLWTTPTDLAHFAINLQHSLAGKADGILSQAAAREMLKPVGPGTWSMGFRVGGGNDHPYFMHGGSNEGFRALLVAFDDGDGIAVMTNGDGGLGITSALVRTAAAEYGWPEFQPKRHRPLRVSANELERFVGQYRLGADVAISVTRKGETLYLQIADGDLTEVTPEGPLSFFSRTSDTQVTFQLDADHRPSRIHIDTLLAAYDADRVDADSTSSNRSLPPRDPPSELMRLIGEYGSADARLTVYEEDGALFADGLDLRRARLRRLGAKQFSVDDSTTASRAARLDFELDQRQRAAAVVAGATRLPRRDIGREIVAQIQAGTKQNPVRLRRTSMEATPPTEPPPKRPFDLVDLASVDPTIKFDIRYATSNNFIGFPLYERPAAYLQRPAAEALGRVQRALESKGFGLLVFDGYRPWFVTKMFWDASPEMGHVFVADPSKGSRHNRGCAVDLTLYDLKTGREVVMTGRYDEMSQRSFADYLGGTSRQRWLRDLLRGAMETEGFVVYPQEWWHFDYKDWSDYAIGTATFSEIRRQ